MVKKAPKKLAESYKKLQARSEAAANALKKAQEDRQGALVELRNDCANKAEKYLAGYVKGELAELKSRQEAKEKGQFWVPAEPKVLLVIRLRGINHVPPKQKKILQLFRLIQVHSAILLKSNKATMAMLKLIEPYVTYGAPSWQIISKLVYKRGYAKVNKQRIPITNNLIIKEALGQHGINNIEDLVQELATCGPHFKQANNFLWRFKLSSPKKGLSSKKKSYIQGGDWGNREDKINELVLRML